MALSLLPGLIMSATYECTVKVDTTDQDKRGALTHAINFALCAGGARITSGEYEVTIRRVSAPKITAAQRHVLKILAACDAPGDAAWTELYGKNYRVGVNLELKGLAESGIERPGKVKWRLTGEGRVLAATLGFWSIEESLKRGATVTGGTDGQ